MTPATDSARPSEEPIGSEATDWRQSDLPSAVNFETESVVPTPASNTVPATTMLPSAPCAMARPVSMAGASPVTVVSQTRAGVRASYCGDRLDKPGGVGQTAPMLRYLRPATILFGILFTILGVRWLIHPLESATQLGMPLLDGTARSTQIGDLGMFFLVAGVTMLLGVRAGHARLLYVPAALVGGAAVARTIAWAFHGAAFPALFVAVEVVVGVVLVVTARELDEGW